MSVPIIPRMVLGIRAQSHHTSTSDNFDCMDPLARFQKNVGISLFFLLYECRMWYAGFGMEWGNRPVNGVRRWPWTEEK